MDTYNCINFGHVLKKPRLLKCGHLICEGCAEGIAAKATNSNVVKCPSCRTETDKDELKDVPIAGFAATCDEVRRCVECGGCGKRILEGEEFCCRSCIDEKSKKPVKLCGVCAFQGHRDHDSGKDHRVSGDRLNAMKGEVREAHASGKKVEDPLNDWGGAIDTLSQAFAENVHNNDNVQELAAAILVNINKQLRVGDSECAMESDLPRDRQEREAYVRILQRLPLLAHDNCILPLQEVVRAHYAAVAPAAIRTQSVNDVVDDVCTMFEQLMKAVIPEGDKTIDADAVFVDL